MKIAFFIGSMRRGGAERVISILANHYIEKNCDVDIVLLLENKVDYELNEKIKIVNLSGKHKSYLRNAPFWFSGIRKYLKEAKPDRVVSFVGRINALVLASTVGMKIPVIVSERNDPKHDGRGAFMLSLCNKLYGAKRCKTIVYQTKYEESCFSSSLTGKGHIIPNPVEVKSERAKEIDKYRAVTAGRLIHQKNHAMMIKAISALLKEFPQIKLDIYGDGTLKDSLEEQINSLEACENITLQGNVSDLHSRISNSGMFIMTSEFEGLSNALIEAMMLGIPCISTDYEGVREIINDGVNGILVPRGDDEKLTEAVRLLLTDDELRNKLSENALETAENYKKTVVLEQWDRIILKEG